MRTLIAGVALLATVASASAECWEPVVPSYPVDQRLFIEGDRIWGYDLECRASRIEGGIPHVLYTASCWSHGDVEPYQMRIGVTKNGSEVVIRFEDGWSGNYRSCERTS